MAIALNTITIPTPQPYDPDHPSRQRENYAYVWLQILDAAKTAAENVSVNDDALVTAVTDLKFNGLVFDLGPIQIYGDGITSVT